MPVCGIRGQRIREDGAPGNGKQNGAHSLHLRLGSVLRLGQRTLQPAPDQHRDTRHHRVVRGRHAARTDRSTWTSRCPGELELAVERLTSGNQLYDRELRRRIDARRYPTIGGRVTSIVLDGSHPDYVVTGEIPFHGKTRTFAHGMQIEAREDGIALIGRGRLRHSRVRHEAARAC